jgi:hypothetical protein
LERGELRSSAGVRLRAGGATQITLVQNWFEELKHLVSTK